MTAVSAKYRTVQIQLPGPLEPEDLKLLASVLDKYPRDDLYYSVDGHALTVHLRSLDLQSFRSAIEHLRSSIVLPISISYRIPPPSRALAVLERLLTSIERIRNYGVKAGKRVYTGYADERKVRNRKAKVSHRAQYYYALDNTFSQESNPLPEHLTNRIICGDSQHILKDFPDNCIDLVFTSPPTTSGLNTATTVMPPTGDSTSTNCSPYWTSASVFSNTADASSSTFSPSSLTTFHRITS